MTTARAAINLLAVISVVAFTACSTASSDAGPRHSSIESFEGAWKGTQTSSSSGRIWNVVFRMSQENGKLQGSYLCTGGNATCRNNIQNGKVEGNPESAGFRVVLEDSSWCAFSGDFYPEDGQGDYSCYNQGALVDQGIWRLKKASTETSGKPS
jgi:hypothetical protein